MKLSTIIFAIVVTVIPLAHVSAKGDGSQVPVIYCTDLFHPHEDPDDHFDIACLYAMPEVQIKAIILDQGRRQRGSPGSVPVSQLNSLTGRNIPYAIGLAEKLESVEDKGLGQSREYQSGVELILSVLSKSDGPVTIITVGSLRDVAAGYNREPELFRAKVDRLVVFIGEASLKGYIEYNVTLDTNAYIRIMNAGLPVWWVPCFDGGVWQNNGSASYWKAAHMDLLGGVSSEVMNYFVYALLRKNETDPVGHLTRDTGAEDKEKVLMMDRNLWCSAVFAYVAGRRFVASGRNEVISVPATAFRNEMREVKPFDFEEVSVYIDEQGNALYDKKGSNIIKRFRVVDRENYAAVMTLITAGLLCELDSR